MIQAEFFSIQTVNFGEFVHQESISKAGLQFSGAENMVSIYNLSNAIFCTDRKKMHFLKTFQVAVEILRSNLIIKQIQNHQNCKATRETSKIYQFVKFTAVLYKWNNHAVTNMCSVYK